MTIEEKMYYLFDEYYKSCVDVHINHLNFINSFITRKNNSLYFGEKLDNLRNILYSNKQKIISNNLNEINENIKQTIIDSLEQFNLDELEIYLLNNLSSQDEINLSVVNFLRKQILLLSSRLDIMNKNLSSSEEIKISYSFLYSIACTIPTSDLKVGNVSDELSSYYLESLKIKFVKNSNLQTYILYYLSLMKSVLLLSNHFDSKVDIKHIDMLISEMNENMTINNTGNLIKTILDIDILINDIVNKLNNYKLVLEKQS